MIGYYDRELDECFEYRCTCKRGSLGHLGSM